MWLLRLLPVALAVSASPSPSPSPSPSGAQCLGSTCFALFWAARSFAEADGACQGGGGRLMTVRSTVAAEAIALLLRGGPGRAWLGLHLPLGACHERGKKLRGFQWVSGDERTDYAAWAGDGAEGDPLPALCGPRCVAVTPEALSWEESSCDAPSDGFFCEYSFPSGTCAPLNPPPALEVLYVTPFGAREAELAALPPGSMAQVPSLGVTLECRVHGQDEPRGRWHATAKGAWDCRLENGGCEGQCQPGETGQPHCTCPGGVAFLEADGRSCRSPCAHLACEHHCVPQGDSAVCMCMEGYLLDADGKSCLDVDDCQAQPGPCEQECRNTPGAFECRCSAGFEMVDGKCQEDRRLCFDLLCQHDCTLINGTHKCTCIDGYVPDPSKPNECLRFCNQSQCPAECDPHTGDHCDCPDGFIYDVTEDDIKVCTDIDECHSGECGKLECVNTPGSYYCVCPNGVIQNQKPCEDEDEGSGGTEVYSSTTVTTTVSPKDGSSRGVLVGPIVSTMLISVVTVLLLC